MMKIKTLPDMKLGDIILFTHCGVDESQPTFEYDGKISILWGNNIWSVEKLLGVCSALIVDNGLHWCSECCPKCDNCDTKYIKEKIVFGKHDTTNKWMIWYEYMLHCEICGRMYMDSVCEKSIMHPMIYEEIENVYN